MARINKVFLANNEAYLSVVHDTSNSIQLQVLIILWESKECDGAALSGSIAYLLENDEPMMLYDEEAYAYSYNKYVL